MVTQGQMKCKIYPSAFSGEVVFQVENLENLEQRYEGIVPNHYVELSTQPTKDGVDGKVKVHVLSDDGKETRVRLPDGQTMSVAADKVHGITKPPNVLEEFIGCRLERVHYVPVALADYESITFSFSNGRCLTVEAELSVDKRGIHPTLRVLKGKWEMIKAEEPKEPGTPDLSMTDGANQD